MLPTLLSVGSLLQTLPLCFVAILVDPGEEVAPVLQVWMCSSRSVWNSPIIWWIRQVSCVIKEMKSKVRMT